MSIEERLAAIERHTSVLPDLQAAMKELKNGAFVTGRLQARQEGTVKDHAEWLEELTTAQQNHAAWLRAHERWMAEIRENGRRLDERIANLVSAIGDYIRGSGGKQQA